MEASKKPVEYDRISQASEAVKEIPKKDFQEMRSFNAPPEAVKDVLSATMLLLGHPESEVNWTMIKKYLGKSGEESLQHKVGSNDFAKIPQENIKKAKAILSKYDANRIAQVSQAAKELYIWADAVVDN
ncbi:cytoplasmic dynein 2 heavy chain 1-like [Mercenaria mercenaria]|uniref:cytoplasmic dynein 2 heavy chain 1-like n=1 Tax=Mercenaria mercenaria TaxID=6596 RepID=UPI00234EF74C|nr:cytoplasmic dynein 2 heavy chain 1-like [Mercenaria mercenaria]